jgi:glucose-1-phosphate cytidylyltransferase
MKVVLFCGGAGMRLRGVADDLPKPMVPIGTRPILWHLMKYYAYFGHKDFILCLGHKGDVIQDYFLNHGEPDWTIDFAETGAASNVGERLKSVQPRLDGEEMFLANYGDGLSDLPLPAMLAVFRRSSAVATLALVAPTATFDLVGAEPGGIVRSLGPVSRSDLRINGGFFAMRSRIFDYIRPGEELVGEVFQRLIAERALLAYKYEGFWQCMDTFKDMQRLETLDQGAAPWKLWERRDAPPGSQSAL